MLLGVEDLKILTPANLHLWWLLIEQNSLLATSLTADEPEVFDHAD